MKLPGFGPSSPTVQPAAAPPTRADPEIAAAQQRSRLAEKRRRGRGSTRIAGQLGDAPTESPELRSSRLLGG